MFQLFRDNRDGIDCTLMADGQVGVVTTGQHIGKVVQKYQGNLIPVGGCLDIHLLPYEKIRLLNSCDELVLDEDNSIRVKSSTLLVMNAINMPQGSIGEITHVANLHSQQHIGTVVQRWGDGLVALGKTSGDSWSTLPNFEVRLLGPGDRLIWIDEV